MTLFLDGVAKISLLVGAVLAAMPLLRARSAALRHWILACALLCAAAMPGLTLVAPAWRLPIGATRVAPAADVRVRDGVTYTVVADSTGSVPNRGGHATPSSAGASAPRGPVIVGVVLAVWAAGTIAGAAALGVGFLRLRRLARRARPLDDRRWIDGAAEIAHAAGLTRAVRLLAVEHPALLVTWGIRRPTIMLPSTARHWSGDRIRIVLQHEIAHVERGDWLLQIAAEIVRSLHWFNPIVWLACRDLRRESERACDDAVLCGGVPPADYASHLVDLARALSAHRRPYVPAPAMARSSGLEGRITAMLNARVNRRPVTRPVRLAAVGVLLVAALSVAGVRAQRFATFSGTLLDQTNAVLPDVAVSLSNPANQSRHEVRTDRTGHFEMPGLLDGDYQLAIDQPGFKAVRDPVTIAGRDVARTIQLQLGDLQETLSIRAGGAPRPADPESRAKARAYLEQRMQKVAERCTGAGAADAAPAIGGNILQPTKVADVKPRYPDGAQPGVVTLDALIGTDGSIRDVRVVSGDPQLGAAAAEAIRQWEFSPTYLNCTPVEVRMAVIANFVAK